MSARILELRPQPRSPAIHWHQVHELVMSHGRRVAYLAYPLARRWGLAHSEALRIAEAGYLHDLGKTLLPEHVLFKAEGLNDSDRLIVETHTTVGFRLISKFAQSLNLDYRIAASVSLHHHERWDGGGYPLGLRADAIPFEAQLIAVVDVFDALVSGRTYKPAWPVRLALDELRDNAGRRFNSRIVALFVDMVKESQSQSDSLVLTDQDLALDILANRAFMNALLRRAGARESG
jgi:putative two-component system response regulator